MRNRDHENLSKSNILKVIGMLEQEKPVTKKVACEVLNISYNTARLGKLIEEFKTNEINNKARRKKLRGTPLNNQELSMIAQEYLNGEALNSISDQIYRPISLIKEAIESLGIPERNADNTYFNPPLLPEEAVKENYEVNDLVFSARYNSPALIDKKLDSEDGPVYVIYVLGKEQCSATQPFWELSDLTRVQNELKVNIKPQQGMNPSYNPPNKG